jgi:hypothetical protein
MRQNVIYALMNSVAFSASIFTKLKAAQRHYVGILHTKFNQNLSRNIERTHTNSFKPIRKVRMKVTELIFTKLKLAQQLFIMHSCTEFHENTTNTLNSDTTPKTNRGLTDMVSTQGVNFTC